MAVATTVQTFVQSKQNKDLINQVDKTISAHFKNYAPGCAVLIARKGQL